MRSLLVRLGWSSALALAVTLPCLAVEVRDVRLWSGPESTRLVLDLSGKAQNSLQTLQNPDRIVLDIPSARLRHGVRTPGASAGVIKSVRITQRRARPMRIVIELAHAVQPKSFMTPPN